MKNPCTGLRRYSVLLYPVIGESTSSLSACISNATCLFHPRRSASTSTRGPPTMRRCPETRTMFAISSFACFVPYDTRRDYLTLLWFFFHYSFLSEFLEPAALWCFSRPSCIFNDVSIIFLVHRAPWLRSSRVHGYLTLTAMYWMAQQKKIIASSQQPWRSSMTSSIHASEKLHRNNLLTKIYPRTYYLFISYLYIFCSAYVILMT